jgi:hypothetical protein
MRKYYLHDGVAQQGPYTLEEIKQKNINPETHIWFDLLPDWTPAGRLEELKELFGATPPPFRNSLPPRFDQPLPSYGAYAETKRPNRSQLYAGIAAGALAVVIGIFYFTSNKSAANSTTGPEVFTDTATRVVDSNKIKLEALEEKERQRQTANEELTKKNREYRNNWGKYIDFSTNSYRVGSLGGIYDLEIYISNNTDKILDEVTIKVDYYLANGSYYKQQEVEVRNIQPNSAKSVRVPDASRGTRIETAISRITSRSLHFCYDRLNDLEFSISTDTTTMAAPVKEKSLDPWFCK